MVVFDAGIPINCPIKEKLTECFFQVHGLPPQTVLAFSVVLWGSWELVICLHVVWVL